MDECRQVAVLCCRILSGSTIIDPSEPSVTAIWYTAPPNCKLTFPRPLVNVSYALDFPSGKIWVAEQLELIASRYLNRNASIVAQKVRETMVPANHNNLKFITAMRPNPPTLGGHGKLVVPENTNWPGVMEETDIFPTFPDEGRT